MFIILSASVLVVLCGMFLYRGFTRAGRNYIKQQFSMEIRDIVRQEISGYVAKNKDNSVKVADSGKENGSGGKVNDEWGSEIRKYIKEELAYYVGGNAEPGSVSVAGVGKKQMSVKSQADDAESGLAEGDVPAEFKMETEEASKKTAGREQSIERTLVQKGGMLLPKGKLQIEPSIAAAHFSSNRINIQGFSILPVLVIGEISTEEVKRDIIISSLSFKYGLLNNLQADLKIPYRYEFDRVSSDFGESTRNYDGIGDIEVGLSRQIAYERGIIPDTIISLVAKSRTGKSPYGRDIGLGTGHWGVRGALIAAKSSDPVVVFGSLSYTWNIKRDIDEYGTIDPGDTIGYSLGTALALSYQTAINFQLEHSVTSKMKSDGRSINGSFLNAASLKTGFTWSTSDRSSVDFSVSRGLTNDAPDYVIELRFPFTF